MGRRRSRIAAMQMLYQVDVGKSDAKQVLEAFLRDYPVGEDTRNFSSLLFEGTIRNIEEIDGLIEQCSDNWTIDRMASVDRNILRLATFELLYLDEISPNITINEAIEIAKKYSTEESSRFINGILDEIKQLVEERKRSEALTRGRKLKIEGIVQ